MLDKTTIVGWVDELGQGLGVRESISWTHLVERLRPDEFEKCIQLIARQLLLPISIKLVKTSEFSSTELSPTDSSGCGTQYITAQVGIPNDLPLWGSAALKGFPIIVRISPTCGDDYSAWITIVSHELAHVLLHSLRHPQADNEPFTDSTAMVLGFSEIMRKGRKQKSARVVSVREDELPEQTLGYLSDEEFEWAYERIRQLREQHRDLKRCVLSDTRTARMLADTCGKMLFKFSRYLAYIDRNPPAAMKKQDATKVVAMHQAGYAEDIQQVVGAANAELAEALKSLDVLDHYSKQSLTKLNDISTRVSGLRQKLEKGKQSLADDTRTLGKYVSIFHKLRIATMKVESAERRA